MTRYHPPGVKHEFGRLALGWYTANLLSGLPSDGLDCEIYAEELPGQPASYQVNSHTTVFRCWTPGVFSVVQIARAVAKNKPDLVHVQHEPAHFGPYITALTVPLLFLLIRAMRTRTVVTLHHVYPLPKLHRAFLRQYGLRIPPFLLRLAIWLAIAPIVILADSIIVHAEKFASALARDYGLSRQTHKVTVLPLGVEDLDTNISNEEAKTRLGFHGKRVLFFLGNLTGYKGLEILIDSMGRLEENYDDLVLIVGGRDTPGFQVSTGEGQSYSEWLGQRAKEVSSNIHFVGFIGTNELPIYFAMADLVVLPYTLDVSSSGPLALTISYKRPFIVSTVFSGVVGLSSAMFEPTVPALVEKIRQFMDDEDLRHDIMAYGRELLADRLWSRVGERTNQLYGTLLENHRRQWRSGR